MSKVVGELAVSIRYAQVFTERKKPGDNKQIGEAGGRELRPAFRRGHTENCGKYREGDPNEVAKAIKT